MDVRKDFPFLNRRMNDKPIIYLDNAATTQKPQQVIDVLTDRYAAGMANVHRAVNNLSDEVTQQFETARKNIAGFINAQKNEISFTYNATHAINYICHSLTNSVKPLKVLVSSLEHHSNYLPWMQAGEVIPLQWDEQGFIDLEDLQNKLSLNPDLVTVTHASNFLGTLQPVKQIIEICKSKNVPVLIDASQSIPHIPIDVRDIGCAFLVFSSHKVYAPGGVGVLFINQEIMDTFQPAQWGGGMVKEVHSHNFVENDIPYRFEAGTPNIESVIALAAALEYMSEIGYEEIEKHENELLKSLKSGLMDISGVSLNGPQNGLPQVPVVSFSTEGLEATAVTKVMGNRANIIIRSGFHCAQPAHDQLGLAPSARVSLGIYNSAKEIDLFLETLNSLVDYI